MGRPVDEMLPRAGMTASMPHRFLQKVFAVCGLDLDTQQLPIALDSERHASARGAETPHCAKELRQARHRLAGDFEHDIAGLHARALRWSELAQARDDEGSLLFACVH